MRLELPPERQLPNPEWMLERIFAERRAAADRRPAARTYWLSGLVAAAVVLIAGVIGWAVLFPTGRPQVGAAPETSPVASAGPSNAASPTVGPSRVSPVPSSGPASKSAVPGERSTAKRSARRQRDHRVPPRNRRAAPRLVLRAPLRRRPAGKARSRRSRRQYRSVSAFTRRTST